MGSHYSTVEPHNRVEVDLDAIMRPKVQRTVPRKMPGTIPNTTGVLKRRPSVELIQQVYALLKFERDGGLETCLRGAECNGALKELREACLEGIAILQDNECQDDSIQEVVAKVSKALGEALYMSAKRGVGKRVFNRYTKG
ncbi:g773 [Coccomyxa viridis]|uniref:G773 protein n=1 Tax=Coccomyxa viridis TaxID=1274662 RepID=A0ABP1FGN4_9CHLO